MIFDFEFLDVIHFSELVTPKKTLICLMSDTINKNVFEALFEFLKRVFFMASQVIRGAIGAQLISCVIQDGSRDGRIHRDGFAPLSEILFCLQGLLVNHEYNMHHQYTLEKKIKHLFVIFGFFFI